MLDQNSSQYFSWSSFGITDVGKVRQHNEDSFLDQPEFGLWVVADGMGGHTSGDVASQMIVSSLQTLGENNNLPHYIDTIEDCLVNVNKKLIDMAKQAEGNITIGSTVIAMIAYSKYCIYLWAGDSRLYRMRDGQLRQMMRDHSRVEIYVQQGLLSREEAAVHPHGNVITRAVGVSNEIFLEMEIQKMQAGDRYLLCSDGLTKHIDDLELEDILSKQGSSKESCQNLIDMTLSRGAGDNVTSIVVDIDDR